MSELTTHQRLIYLLWRNGVCKAEIVARRGIKYGTVDSNLRVAKAKLGVDGQAPRALCPWPPGCVWS